MTRRLKVFWILFCAGASLAPKGHSAEPDLLELIRSRISWPVELKVTRALEVRLPEGQVTLQRGAPIIGEELLPDGSIAARFGRTTLLVPFDSTDIVDRALVATPAEKPMGDYIDVSFDIVEILPGGVIAKPLAALGGPKRVPRTLPPRIYIKLDSRGHFVGSGYTRRVWPTGNTVINQLSLPAYTTAPP